MKSIHFNCYKIAEKLPLDKLASFFGIKIKTSWNNYLVLDEAQINTVLKHKVSHKQVYVYDFGCITFVNFNSDELKIMLDYIESIAGKIDYNLYINYQDTHIIPIDEHNIIHLWNSSEETFIYNGFILPIVATILAKSTALKKIEYEVSQLLDNEEVLILNLQKRRSRGNARQFAATAAAILRFEYSIINNIRIFDRSQNTAEKMQYRAIYDKLSNYYELQDRYEILEKKATELRNITKAYSNYSFDVQNRRLLLFEVFLLALFPAFHIIHSIMDRLG